MPISLPPALARGAGMQASEGLGVATYNSATLVTLGACAVLLLLALSSAHAGHRPSTNGPALVQALCRVPRKLTRVAPLPPPLAHARRRLPPG